MITIYGSPKSSSGRCFWCLEEIGQAYEGKSINFKEKEHKSQEYLKINPNGKVPSLTDGDFTIWESMAINLYLAEAYKPELIGKTPQQRGLVYQWSIWSMVELQSPLIDVFIQLIFVPEERRNMDVIEKAKTKLPALLATLESRLSHSSYLAGDEFTLADLNTESVIQVCEFIEYDLSTYKSIMAWRQSLTLRPAHKKFMDLCK